MLRITQAQSKDKTDVANLFNQYRIFYQMNSDSKSAMQFISERLDQSDSIIYLARFCKINIHSEFSNRANEACGFIQIYPAFSSVAMRPIWILNDLFVNDQCRNKGIAKGLMEHARLEAQKRGIFSIKLATAVDNSTAKNLYESLNYKKIDKFDNYSLKI
ncbi:MAG: GNAT family N-acetyltransferase [Kangiellaceae bacterium]